MIWFTVILPIHLLFLYKTTRVPCGCCEFCDCFDTRQIAILPTGIKWQQKHWVTCTTMGIIYLLQSACGAFYIGKTRRPLSVRISEHIAAANTGFFRTVKDSHIAFVQNYAFEGFTFFPLTRIDRHDREDR